MSCDTPTADTWGDGAFQFPEQYDYKRTYPHSGIGHYVF
jgi:hypothetical protein